MTAFTGVGLFAEWTSRGQIYYSVRPGVPVIDVPLPKHYIFDSLYYQSSARVPVAHHSVLTWNGLDCFYPHTISRSHHAQSHRTSDPLLMISIIVILPFPSDCCWELHQRVRVASSEVNHMTAIPD